MRASWLANAMFTSRYVFTSGGTESNNLALLGVAANRPGAIVVSAIEHSSLKAAAGFLEQSGRPVVRRPRGGVTRRAQQLARCARILLRNYRHHADAAVEHAQHFGFRDTALLLQPAEQRRPRPAALVQPRAQMSGQDAGHVIDNAAAGNVGQPFERNLLHQLQYRFHIDARGREYQVA